MDYFVQIIDKAPSGAVLPSGDYRVLEGSAAWEPVKIASYPQDGKRYLPGNPRLEEGVLIADWIEVEDSTHAARTVTRARTERSNRDARIKDFEWRYTRYERNARLGLPQQDDLKKLDVYVQALADVPSQEGFPWQISWPVYTP